MTIALAESQICSYHLFHHCSHTHLTYIALCAVRGLD